jgi:hypothetical protein
MLNLILIRQYIGNDEAISYVAIRVEEPNRE